MRSHTTTRSFLFQFAIRVKVTQNIKSLHVDKKSSLFSLIQFIFSLQFHQTIKTYLSHRIWQFYFYVSKNWPEEEACLHFPGCTLTPNNNIYESFAFFCPVDRLELVELIKNEDVLFDWSMPMYLNYTPVKIMDRIEEFLKTIGHVEHIQGEVFVCNDNPDCLDLGELPTNEVVRL